MALIVWLLIVFIWQIKSISGLNIWYFVKFFELVIVAYGTTFLIFKNQEPRTKNYFLSSFVALGTLQSVIGLLQFINQSPIGLNAVGEQIIYPNLWGVAKIACPVACQFIGSATGVSSGTTFIRAYGTFPHPNLLGAFLVATILINIYLLVNYQRSFFRKSQSLISNFQSPILWLNLALFINILGLTVTFSRGAFLALAVGLIVYFGFSIVNRGKGANGSLVMVIVMVIVSLASAFALFRPFLLTRATVSDQATIERKVYNQTAVNMVKNKPIFGLGMGESVLHMKQFSPVDLNSWQIQPIHNYFLLSAAELGIPGALILIWIFLFHLKSLILNLKSRFDSYNLLLTTLLLIFLVLMLFDHYFYTLQQTQILLWMVLGLIAAETHKFAP